MMMTIMVKRFLAVSMLLATIGSLSACTVTREETQVEREVPEERVTVTEEEAPMAEREVARRPMTTQETTQALQNLQPGQTVSYYTQQFERMGFRTQDVDYQDDRVVYDLMRDNQAYQVSLIRPAEGERVQRIESRQLRQVAAGRQAQDQQSQRIVQQIQQLQPGKRPAEYIPMVDRFGKVTEYELRQSQATIEMEANNKRYHINMNLDPSGQTVRTISVDQRIWEFPG